MGLYEELKGRGLIAQCTNEEKVRELLNGDESVTFYIGFDPTADSLHIGHFLQLVIMRHMQQAGHKPIALIGGGTAMVGDPTGRTDMREMLTPEKIQHNGDCFKVQMRNMVDFSDGKAIMVNNADWLMDLNYIGFLREIGVHFSVNRMLTAECFKSRLERGLSFIEFNYMLMQSYDFYRLHKDYGCMIELGGDDQWSNIINGIDLVRRMEQKEVYGLTFALLTTSEGKKMGKTQKGAVWIDPNKTSPYDFFQYWRNTADADVIKCLKFLTFLPLEEIAQYENLEGQELNKIKEILAYEVTKLVHGKDEADKALETARAVFNAGGVSEDMPSTALSEEDFTDGAINIIELLTKTKLAPSKGEARRLVEQGGVQVDGVKVASFTEAVAKDRLNEGVIIKKGKKVFHRVTL